MKKTKKTLLSIFFSYGEVPEVLHKLFTPVRIYYRLTRWLFGNDYKPFESNIKHGLHPLLTFFKIHRTEIRIMFYSGKIMIPILVTILIVYFIEKLFDRLSFLLKNELDL